jgi:hypothetical protein
MQTVINNYLFNPSLKKITFSEYSNIHIENLISIINLTTNTIIYTTKSLGETINFNELTLPFVSMVDMNSTDKLQIIYDIPLSFDENGKLETTAVLEANSVDVIVGEVDLTGDSILALQALKLNNKFS